MKLAATVNNVNIFVSDNSVFPAQIAAALGLDVESYTSENRYYSLAGDTYAKHVFFLDLYDTLGTDRRVALLPVDKAIDWVSYIGSIMMSFFGDWEFDYLNVKPETTLDPDHFYASIKKICQSIQSHSSLTRDHICEEKMKEQAVVTDNQVSIDQKEKGGAL